MNRLEQLIKLAPNLSDLLENEDIMVAITDTSNYLYYSRSKTLDAKIKLGSPFLDHDLFGHITKKQAQFSQISPPEYGPAFKAIGSPIFDDKDKLIGCIGFGLRLNRKDAFLDTIAKLDDFFRSQPDINEIQNISLKHYLLNEICVACGKYGQSQCFKCSIEIKRQQEVMNQMRNRF